MSKLLKYLQFYNREISIVFVDDAEIQELNNLYLNRNYPTNVISFPISESGEFRNINPEILGDIVISAESALKDSQKGGISFDDEVDFLLIHGLLHLLGYNHESTAEKISRVMKKKEKELFAWLNGYEIDNLS